MQQHSFLFAHHRVWFITGSWKGGPYKSPATISVDSCFWTRPNLRLWIEASDNASKVTAGREKCGREVKRDQKGINGQRD